MPERLRVVARGAVQGVGFRPFVYRLARELRLHGEVRNAAGGVIIEVEGPRSALDTFLARLEPERPPRSVIQSLEPTWLDPCGFEEFSIRESADGGEMDTLVLPDIATCDDCRRDIADSSNRRYRYPFTNCTNCGPRYSIIEAMPYDRARTSMRAFEQCAACRAEYENPEDRRFHAQPNACPVCGPRLALLNPAGGTTAIGDAALIEAARAVARGQIVALKGLGGFQLLADAGREDVVRELRRRKHRDEKPLALMCPSLEAARGLCDVGPLEARLLTSAEAPIVLLDHRADAASPIAPSVAGVAPTLGVMLPYTPLHHLLMAEVGRPVVATSGNLSDEPMCIDEHEALERLHGIADVFLVHDRPIVRHVDDSVARIVLGRELIVRRARGYAPLPVALAAPSPPAIAVGAHLKSTVAAARGTQVFVSQHLGDLETPQATAAFRRAIEDIAGLFRISPEVVVADMHPAYASSSMALTFGRPVARVQHHVAHVAATMADNALEPPVLGVSWDGTGYGPDQTVWGGEFLQIDRGSWRRVACLRPFRLPGGERAVREPRRSALGLIHAVDPVLARERELGDRLGLTAVQQRALADMLDRNLNAPLTTSAGRLFDGLAALAGLAAVSTFEGQGAMALEWAVDDRERAAYPVEVVSAATAATPGSWSAPDLVVDWHPMVAAVLDDLRAGTGAGAIASRVHRALARGIVAVAERHSQQRVVLTGGCFQNRVLTELAVAGLRASGRVPYWSQRIPPNDGGVAPGQLAAWRWGLDGPPCRTTATRTLAATLQEV